MNNLIDVSYMFLVFFWGGGGVGREGSVFQTANNETSLVGLNLHYEKIESNGK